MWRHIPKITVLSAIGLMVLIFYVTRWNQTPAPVKAAAPNVVYINQGVGTEKSAAPRP
jgi:glucose dehydrogenase